VWTEKGGCVTSLVLSPLLQPAFSPSLPLISELHIRQLGGCLRSQPHLPPRRGHHPARSLPRRCSHAGRAAAHAQGCDSDGPVRDGGDAREGAAELRVMREMDNVCVRRWRGGRGKACPLVGWPPGGGCEGRQKKKQEGGRVEGHRCQPCPSFSSPPAAPASLLELTSLRTSSPTRTMTSPPTASKWRTARPPAARADPLSPPTLATASRSGPAMAASATASHLPSLKASRTRT